MNIAVSVIKTHHVKMDIQKDQNQECAGNLKVIINDIKFTCLHS